MKQWKDANEVINMINEMPSRELEMIEKEMKKKPNFEHPIEQHKKS